MIVYILLFFCISGGSTQTGPFKIGFPDQSVYNYVISNIPRTYSTIFNFQILSLPSNFYSSVTGFNSSKLFLSSFHAIIGTFEYNLATVCADSSLSYFIIDEQISRVVQSQPLLDYSLNIRSLGGALNYILNKYNWTQNFRFISDSSINAMDILWMLSGNTIQQCNFLPTDVNTTIAGCFQNLSFVNSPGMMYVIVTDDSNYILLESIMRQTIYRSLTYQSFVFYPMMNTSAIMIRYHYAGGVLYSIKQTINNSETSYSLKNTNALQAFQFINQSITINKTVASQVNGPAMLKLFLNQSTFTSTGSKLNYNYYWSVLQDMVTFIPKLVSTVTYNGIFSIPTAIADPRIVSPIDVINTLYITDPVYAINVINSDQTITPRGFIVESLNNLLLPMKLSFTMTMVSGSNIIGRYNASFSTGMIGAMYNNLSDMTSFPVPIINSYRNRFLYSAKIFDVPYSILLAKETTNLDLSRLARSYSIMVWIIILALICFLSFILFFTNLISPNIAEDNNKLTINNSTFMVIGSFLIAKLLVKPNMISTQIFYLIIWLVTLLIIASYVANLSVSLAFQKSQNIQFSTLPILLNQSSIKWVFMQDSILYNQVMDDISQNNTNSVFYQLYQTASQGWPNFLLNSSVDVPNFLKNNTAYGLLNDQYHNYYYSLKDCSLITLLDSTTTVSMAYLLQPGFKYQTQLYQQIISLQAKGVIETLEKKYLFVGQCSTINSIVSSVDSLDYEQMAGLFILLGFGIVVAFPAALIEFFMNKSKLQCQRTITGNSLKFGQIYETKVKALDKNGVTVDIGRMSLFANNDDGRFHYVPKKYLGIKRTGDREILSPTDQGIMIGTKLLLKYMGNNPVNSKRIFVQVPKKR